MGRLGEIGVAVERIGETGRVVEASIRLGVVVMELGEYRRKGFRMTDFVALGGWGHRRGERVSVVSVGSCDGMRSRQCRC